MKISSRLLSVAIGIAMVPGIALVDAAPAAAVSSTAKTSFITKVVSAAQATQRKFGVPASVLIAQAIVASDWGTSTPAKNANNYFDTPCSAKMTASQFASLAAAQVGKPYVLGAEAAITNTNPSKFDCSELVEWLFGRSGNPITDLAASQYNVTKAVAKGSSPKAGDLVFLRNNPARSNGIGHVAVLTKKLSSGDWQIIEARGRAYGVVKTTLSYWKSRSYYAGLRRYSKLVFADGGSVAASAASSYQSGCTTISSSRYAKYSSLTNSFYAHAAAVTGDSAYKAARGVINDIPKFVDALAKVERPKDAAGYAATIKSLISTYKLTNYEVVPFTIVLDSGDKGPKVTALQQLLLAQRQSVKATGSFDSATVKAVKKFQAAKKLTVDGEAGPKTLSALFATLESGATGDRVKALHSMLAGLGLPATSGSTFGKETTAGVKAFQANAGRSASGRVDANTWALLYMTPSPAPTPTIKGTAKVNEKLTATPGTWGPGSVALAYQWYRDDNPIAEATGLTYTLQGADAGTKITFAATGTKAGYTTVRRSSAATGSVAKALLTSVKAPKIGGTPAVGATLTADPGTWSPATATFGYQWYRGAKAISGATKSTYVVQAADAGQKLKVVVSGTKPGYETLARTTASTGAVAKGSLATTPTPKVEGTAAVGGTLTADPGTWAPAPVELSYQWYRGNTAISGAISDTYKLKDADAKAKITVKVTGTKAGYTSVSKTSAVTAVTQPAKLTAPTPKISGTAKVGKTLKVTPGTWGPGTVKLKYRWYRGSQWIHGAHKTSYKLTSADKGKTIKIKVTGSRSGYAEVSKMSSGVKPK